MRLILTERTIQTSIRPLCQSPITGYGTIHRGRETMNEQDRFIERIGLIFEESERMPRIASRILGLLLVTPGECSIDEMAEHLSVSRASISVDARRLEECGVVERLTRRGDRRDYYRIAPDHYARTLERRLNMMERLAAVIDDGRQMKIESREVRERLDDTAAALRLVVETTTQELKRWRVALEKRSVERHESRSDHAGV